MKVKFIILIVILVFLGLSCSDKKDNKTEEPIKEEDKDLKMIKDFAQMDHIKNQLKKFVTVAIEYDDSQLNENQKNVLTKLVQAADYMDKIFLEQVYSKNEEILNELNKKNTPEYSILKQYFKIQFGPFDRREHNKPYINLNTSKPPGGNYYPEDMTREEFDRAIEDNPELKESFMSEFTIIRRDKEGQLVAIPYSKAYKKYLEPAARLLNEAAEEADNPSLKKYLISRAASFLSNDYYQSDIDWMDLTDHKIEVVIGPYEVYEDAMFGYKAAFEAFITIVDEKESQKLKEIGKHLTELEKFLPIPEEHKNFNRGSSSPIKVVNEVFTAGDTKADVQTLAFNLPNDERVREAKGSKKVMLKNILRAKFDKIWKPIAEQALVEKDFKNTSFDAYFNHVLMHEISHGLGPGKIKKNGKETSVRLELKDLYSMIEEAKADVLGIYTLQYLIEKGIMDKKMAPQIYETYLGGMFRSVRFGVGEAHGGANAIELNYILEKGGFVFDSTKKKFSVNQTKIKSVIKELAAKLLMIEATGDYEKASELIKKYKIVSEELSQVLEKVVDVPIDIFPKFAIKN